jgi:hypothetical protein
MTRLPLLGVLLAAVCLPALLRGDDPAPKRSPKEALQAFNDLIGAWRGTGQPQQGTKEERDKNFWQETVAWEWQFKDKDAWLKIAFEKGKNFTGGEMRFDPDKEHFVLTLTTVKKDKLTYVGTIETRDKTKILTMDREDGKDTHRLVFRFLHSNRFLYGYEMKADGKALFSKKWSVGATKEGEAFAVGDGKPECIVSGGTGTTPVNYMGKTYYVCCSGCRDEFNAHAAKYVKEYEEKLKAKKK